MDRQTDWQSSRSCQRAHRRAEAAGNGAMNRGQFIFLSRTLSVSLLWLCMCRLRAGSVGQGALQASGWAAERGGPGSRWVPVGAAPAPAGS